ncbi:MAG: HD domain-containing protein [Thermoanaerobaculia bacterium]|nr:HD domain-containing protein [Thermoanaerobaculia bacterium]
MLFVLLLLPGILPLLFSSMHLLRRNQEIVKSQQQEILANTAQNFVGQLSDDLARRRVALEEFGYGILAAPGSSSVLERVSEPWVAEQLGRFSTDQGPFLALSAYAENRQGIGGSQGNFNAQVDQALVEAFDTALRLGRPAYTFAMLSAGDQPAVAVAVPVEKTRPPTSGDGSDQEPPEILVMQTLLPLEFGRPGSYESFELEEFFMVDADGSLLWSADGSPDIERALLESQMVSDFGRGMKFSVTQEYPLEVRGKTQATLARIVPVQETGWGVVAHKPASQAFELVRQMVIDVILWSITAVVLAAFIAALATRWFSRPIQRLAETSHEIAAGKFDRRVPVEGLVTAEIADMATDFNRMSEYVEKYIEQLRRAAEANRSLFISSIRAFAAAIDAKDPYTRGHSERVAAYSRSIARYLGLPKDAQEKVWISAVLHDVGKIGVQDSVLQKHGVLTPDEFEQMKLHPVIGADIVEPISALKDMIPGIRWHHEAWNGTGYPDRLKGEQTPLMARIIGVADTFDAITTNRPYQTASSPEYAIETIKKLTGTKFDAKVVTAFLLAWEAGHIQLDRQRAERSTRSLHTPETSHAVAG